MWHRGKGPNGFSGSLRAWACLRQSQEWSHSGWGGAEDKWSVGRAEVLGFEQRLQPGTAFSVPDPRYGTGRGLTRFPAPPFSPTLHTQSPPWAPPALCLCTHAVPRAGISFLSLYLPGVVLYGNSYSPCKAQLLSVQILVPQISISSLFACFIVASAEGPTQSDGKLAESLLVRGLSCLTHPTWMTISQCFGPWPCAAHTSEFNSHCNPRSGPVTCFQGHG